MLFRAIKCECLKLRGAPVWLAFMLLPLLAAVMGTFNYLQNLGILTKQWYSLWTQHTLFSSFFFLPAFVGVLSAYQWRLEHRENNWNALMTAPVPLWATVLGKLAVNVLVTFLTLAWTGLLYILAGKYAGLSAAIPRQLPTWIFLGACASAGVSSLQLYLSMRIRSFAIPVGISLIGGIAGLAVSNYGYGLYCPYSLIALGMDANGRGLLKPGDYLPFLISCLFFTAAFFFISVETMAKRDVTTG